jgi:hypothetical protein
VWEVEGREGEMVSIINSGFETGDTTGWVESIWLPANADIGVTAGYKHSGSYGCRLRSLAAGLAPFRAPSAALQQVIDLTNVKTLIAWAKIAAFGETLHGRTYGRFRFLTCTPSTNLPYVVGDWVRYMIDIDSLIDGGTGVRPIGNKTLSVEAVTYTGEAYGIDVYVDDFALVMKGFPRVAKLPEGAAIKGGTLVDSEYGAGLPTGILCGR